MTELLHPSQWVRSAERDLAMARLAVSELPDLAAQASYHAQQCVERALKALLMDRELDIPRTHSLADLFRKLQDDGLRVPDEVAAAAGLTRYATETRYADPDAVASEEAREAVRLAERVLAWARAELAS